MELEIILLGCLIIIFIISFCGLLQKIRKTYESDRAYTERVTNVSSPSPSLTEIYINPSYLNDVENAAGNQNSQGIYSIAPPPYTEIYLEPPPKYEDIIKDPRIRIHIPTVSTN